MLFSGFHHQILSGLLMTLEKSNFEVWPLYRLVTVFSAFKGRA